jgi:hypothetical protein
VIAELADGRRLEFPDGTDPAVVQATVKRMLAPQQVKIGQAGFGDALRETLGEQSWLGRNLAGAGTAASNLWEGAKQIAGKGDDQRIQANRIMAEEAPVGALAGNVAMLAPTAMIPGANTVAGAGVIGGINGLLQPTQGDESRLKNVATGTVLSAGGQYLGGKAGDLLQAKLADSLASKSAEQTRNAVRDATLKTGQEAGYVVPPSAVKPSFIGNRLESLGGKAAIGQEAASRNQEITNALARKAVGLADDTPVTGQALEAVRTAAGKPYQEVAALSKIAADDLEALKAARHEAQVYFKHYNVSADPASLEKAKAARSLSNMLEQSLEAEAQTAGRAGLVDELRAARQTIAKTYDLGRAVNEGTGDISAPVLGRLLDKGRPLSGEMETIAKFNKAFPAYTREGAKVPTAGVSKSEALAAALLATGGAAAGGPAGLVAGALPLLSGPARSLALALQKTPNYSPGVTAKALKNLTPERAAVLARTLALSAQ